MLLSVSYSKSSCCRWVVLGSGLGLCSAYTCSSISSALPAPLCWVFLEKRPFFTWRTSLLVSARWNDCNITAWLGRGVSPTVQWRCRENAEPQAENKWAAVARRNSRVKGNSEWKPASHSCRAHLRDVTGRRCILQLSADALLSWRTQQDHNCIKSDVWLCLIPEIVPPKEKCCRNLGCFVHAWVQPAVTQHVSVQVAGQSSLLPRHRVSGTVSRQPVFCLLVKS